MRRSIVVVLFVVMVGLGGIAPTCSQPLDRVTHQATVGSITVSYWQVGKRRIGRTVFEFDFAAEVANDGGDAAFLVGTVSSADVGTVVVDGTVEFGAVSSGHRKAGEDTFTLSQDREAPFDPSMIEWAFRDGDLPPDPGDVGKATLLGVDADGDGVRDDIQRYIVGTTEIGSVRNTMFALVKTWTQLYGISDDGMASREFAQGLYIAVECLFWANRAAGVNSENSRALQAEFFNTDERLDRYLEFNGHQGGTFYESPAPNLRRTLCDELIAGVASPP